MDPDEIPSLGEEMPEKKTQIATSGIPPIESAGLVKWQLESNDLIQELYNWLLGIQYVQDKDGEWVAQQVGKRYCNEKGASAIISIISPYMYKAFILSNFSEDKINSIMQKFCINFVQYLAYYKEEFEIEEGDLPMIKSIIEDTIESNLWRAWKMKTFEGQQATYRSVEEFTQKPAPKKKMFPFSVAGFKNTFGRKR